MITKNQAKVLKIIDEYFYDCKTFRMPTFSKAINKSIFFKENYKKIIKLLGKKNKTVQELNTLDELILSSYFSSIEVVKSIKNVEKCKSKTYSIKLKSLFDRNKKNIVKI